MKLLRRLAAFAAFALLVWNLAVPAWAVQPDEVMADPTLEARARALSSGLRCLVCQNQSIDDSAAPLARDLRLLVRERLRAGDDDAAIEHYLVSRYGDFILLKPPFSPETLLLWGAPALVLAAGLGGVLLARRAQGQAEAAPPLDAAEVARLAALLREPHSG
ncbi:cytochrome c-type biogenesis protein CcmH [Lichenihabitans sp. Uapishka_5]|uniref:cytochrome c-type biogenesis protein n=1 Tax=Lichenihabitans sp. Uapishka_5 TaxID=3037302 RepID=UPI0029E7EE45|nr:cytochrome c-type biogenesis protein [Lichenihabitans sp. Uapishka_5]MDX7953697.1 cytochrome c-type biogenesis protein CcmH [Lichenihabitans sp. Uapishka_5]